MIYEGHSINKLQNGSIPSVLKIGKIRNIRFVGNLNLNIHATFLDDDVIIVTSSDNRTQSICVLFSPSVLASHLAGRIAYAGALNVQCQCHVTGEVISRLLCSN